jgi:flavin-dependent dehydrogenase
VLAHIMETTRGVREALNRARLEGEFLSTGPIHPGIRTRYADDVYFTGNIAGEAHPVIAEGISMAIQSSGLLATLLIEGQAQDYAQAWKRRFAPRIRAASIFAHLAMNDTGRLATQAVLAAAPRLLSLGARLSGKVPFMA